jgi:hypothetical protein
LLTNRTDNGNQRNVNKEKVFVAHTELELPHRFDKGRRLDVADRSSELNKSSLLLMFFERLSIGF